MYEKYYQVQNLHISFVSFVLDPSEEIAFAYVRYLSFNFVNFLQMINKYIKW
jgi:hypothetical protein